MTGVDLNKPLLLMTPLRHKQKYDLPIRRYCKVIAGSLNSSIVAVKRFFGGQKLGFYDN